MLLVHIVPMLAGAVLSFKNLNTFTFHQLFDAPWTGLTNYEAILDSSNPLNDGFVGAVWNTARYTFWTVLGAWWAGWPSRCCSTATCAGTSGRGR